MDDEDRSDFLDLLGRLVSRFEVKIFAFCLMSNHYHLFLRTPLGNLSKGMQWLNGTYTTHFNRRHKRLGHLLQGRYKAVLVLDEAHWLHLSMYLHLNPVRARIVDDPGKYPWSSFRDYTRAKSRFDWLLRDEILSDYGKTKTSRYSRYRRECLALAGTRPDFVQQLKHGLIIGSREVLDKLAKKYRPPGKIEAVPDYSMAAKKEIDPEKEFRRVADVFDVKAEDLLRRRRNFPARFALYYHLVENCGTSVTSTAAELAMGTPSVSSGIRHFRQLLENDKSLRRRVKQLNAK